MSETSTNPIAGSIGRVAEAIDELTANDSVQELQKPLLQRLSSAARGAIYETGKWAGLLGAAALSIAGVVGGEPERYIEAGGLLVLALSNWIAKANIAD